GRVPRDVTGEGTIDEIPRRHGVRDVPRRDGEGEQAVGEQGIVLQRRGRAGGDLVEGGAHEGAVGGRVALQDGVGRPPRGLQRVGGEVTEDRRAHGRAGERGDREAVPSGDDLAVDG